MALQDPYKTGMQEKMNYSGKTTFVRIFTKHLTQATWDLSLRRLWRGDRQTIAELVEEKGDEEDE